MGPGGTSTRAGRRRSSRKRRAAGVRGVAPAGALTRRVAPRDPQPGLVRPSDRSSPAVPPCTALQTRISPRTAPARRSARSGIVGQRGLTRAPPAASNARRSSCPGGRRPPAALAARGAVFARLVCRPRDARSSKRGRAEHADDAWPVPHARYGATRRRATRHTPSRPWERAHAPLGRFRRSGLLSGLRSALDPAVSRPNRVPAAAS